MTDEEYYKLIATFNDSFIPTNTTCKKYNPSSSTTCNPCTFFNNPKDYCGINLCNPAALLPKFYEKVLLLTPEKLL
jgi:hypothetical protein